MEFIPLYFKEKIRPSTKGDAFDRDKINLINPHGTAGIVTLWRKPWDVWDQLLGAYPKLFDTDSPLVALTSLYSNGLPQMLANLAYNPQIERIGVFGTQTKTVPSYTYLRNFLDKGVIVEEGNPLGKIVETTFPLDTQLTPSLFRHLQVHKCETLEELVNFVIQPPARKPEESQRIAITLREPTFSDFPSELTTHVIHQKTPLAAWADLIFTLNRFGKNAQPKKGVRRSLYNLSVTIDDASFEPEAELAKYGFDPNELHAYRKSILDPVKPESMSYTYGNLIRLHNGKDMLAGVVAKLKEDPLDRDCFITLWDNEKHLLNGASNPCITDLYFLSVDQKLVLQTGVRTHNAVSAWMLNAYGLRAMQEYVAEQTAIEPGQLVVRSRWISIDPADAKTASALAAVQKHRRTPLNVNNPRGYFTVNTEGKEIVVEHYTPESAKIRTYRGTEVVQIKNALRHDRAIDDPDHATWMGYNLAAAYVKIHGLLPDGTLPEL